jgi:acetyl esterase/lipase
VTTNPHDLALEPEVQAFAEGSDFLLEFAHIPTEQQRQTLDQIQSMATARPDVTEEWYVVDAGPYAPVNVRVIRPTGVDEDLPAILFVHGGGWAIGNAATHDRLARLLAVGARAAVVFPEYALAPETPFPTALHQCWHVGQWIADHGNELGIDGTRVALAGDQMGATIAASLALLSVQSPGVQFACQLLLNPCTDAPGATESYRLFAEGYVIRAESYRRFWDQYVPDVALRASARVSPLRASAVQMEGLPPSCVITAEADCLRDEGEAYAVKLRRAGVPVLSTRYSGVTNGFMVLDAMSTTMAAQAATEQACAFLRSILHPIG